MSTSRDEPVVLNKLRALVATRRRVVLLVVLALSYGLYSARDALLLRLVRHQLAKVPDVEVSLLSLHLHPLFNGVTLEGVQVYRLPDVERDGPAGRKLRLAEVTELEVRWPWRGLLRGGLACEAYVRGAEASVWRIASLPKRKSGEKPPQKAEAKVVPEPPPPQTIQAIWPQIARFVLPMSVDRVEVENGRFWLRDCTTDPQVKWPVENIQLTAHNLTNRARLAGNHYATVDASATPAGGKFTMHMELDPMAKSPTFGLRSNVENVALFKLNPVLRAYAKLDVEGGTFNTQAEVISEKGRFHGFAQPRIVGLRIRPRATDEAQDSVLNRLWRTGVRAVTSLVENSKEETIATRLPIVGEFTDPTISVWDAVTTLLGNAYLRALRPSTTAVDALPLLKPKAAEAKDGAPAGKNKPDAGGSKAVRSKPGLQKAPAGKPPAKKAAAP